MKWNWGTKLIMVFSIFVLGMVALVVMSMRQKVDLVAKDYYKDELRYQEVLNATNLANGLSAAVKVTKEANAVSIQLPQEMSSTAVKGNVFFYCPSDATKDKHIPLVVDSKGLQWVDLPKLMPGKYIIKISWEFDKKQYYAEQTLTI
jgi:hypothetical protein